MKNVLVLIFFIINLNIAQAKSRPMCDIAFKKISLCANIQFVDGISRKSDAKFTVNYTSLKNGKPVSLDSEPQVKLWMVMKNGHEHGSEPLKITKKKEGVYLHENAWFLMLGEWKVFITAKNNGISEKSFFDVCVKRKKSQSYLGSCK